MCPGCAAETLEFHQPFLEAAENQQSARQRPRPNHSSLSEGRVAFTGRPPGSTGSSFSLKTT